MPAELHLKLEYDWTALGVFLFLVCLYIGRSIATRSPWRDWILRRLDRFLDPIFRWWAAGSRDPARPEGRPRLLDPSTSAPRPGGSRLGRGPAGPGRGGRGGGHRGPLPFRHPLVLDHDDVTEVRERIRRDQFAENERIRLRARARDDAALGRLPLGREDRRLVPFLGRSQRLGSENPTSDLDPPPAAAALPPSWQYTLVPTRATGLEWDDEWDWASEGVPIPSEAADSPPASVRSPPHPLEVD